MNCFRFTATLIAENVGFVRECVSSADGTAKTSFSDSLEKYFHNKHSRALHELRGSLDAIYSTEFWSNHYFCCKNNNG